MEGGRKKLTLFKDQLLYVTNVLYEMLQEEKGYFGGLDGLVVGSLDR